jgi:hypothetical protein
MRPEVRRPQGRAPAHGRARRRSQARTDHNELPGAVGTRRVHPETALAGAKCDVPVRLEDGRLFPIECKVSNSEVNSTKRLIRETRGKHNEWRREFGGELTTGAVLAGAFSLINLRQAQQAGVLPFFEHELKALSAFIKAGAHPRQTLMRRARSVSVVA